MDKLYSDHSNFCLESEHKILEDADIVVLQFPFYWYTVPGVMKQWLDDVLTYGFAYGSKGDKLKGKNLLLSITVGGPKGSYNPKGYNCFPINELLKPLENIAYFTQMKFHEPLLSYNQIFVPGILNTEESVLRNSELHAGNLITTINKIIDEKTEQPVTDPGWEVDS